MRRDTAIAKVLNARVVRAGRGGRGQHSPLYHWMRAHYDTLAAEFNAHGPCWPERVTAMGEAGLVDGSGKPPTLRAAQQTWYRVKLDVERPPAGVQKRPGSYAMVTQQEDHHAIEDKGSGQADGRSGAQPEDREVGRYQPIRRQGVQRGGQGNEAAQGGGEIQTRFKGQGGSQGEDEGKGQAEGARKEEVSGVRQTRPAAFDPLDGDHVPPSRFQVAPTKLRD